MIKDKFILFSGSFSVLKAINNTSSKNPQIQKSLDISQAFRKVDLIANCIRPNVFTL